MFVPFHLTVLASCCQLRRMADDTALSAPQTLEELRDQVAQRLDALPKRLRQCGSVLLREPSRVAVMTVAQFAEAAEAPPSAVIRFAKEFGFSGYSELQQIVRARVVGTWPDYEERLNLLRGSGGTTPDALLAEFVGAGHDSLERLTAIRPESLERAVDLLGAAQMIHLIGFRRSYPAVAYLAYAFEKMNLSVVLHDGGGGFVLESGFRDGDIVLAVSFAPYAPETTALVQRVKARGVKLVGITDEFDAPLGALCDEVLLVSEVDVGAFRSLTATFALAATLAVATGMARDAKKGLKKIQME